MRSPLIACFALRHTRFVITFETLFCFLKRRMMRHIYGQIRAIYAIYRYIWLWPYICYI